MANTNKRATEGKLLAAGPFEGGGGIFIFNTTSIEDVTEWMKADPGIQANRWKLEKLLYTPRTGSVCAVKEPYEMTMYSFVRYIPNIAKFNVQVAPETFGRHDEYLKEIKKTGNVIAEGTFGESEGGILIMKGKVQSEVIDNDPAAREGLLETWVKDLYVANREIAFNILAPNFCNHHPMQRSTVLIVWTFWWISLCPTKPRPSC
jgi:uncharacterized protein YciI